MFPDFFAYHLILSPMCRLLLILCLVGLAVVIADPQTETALRGKVDALQAELASIKEDNQRLNNQIAAVKTAYTTEQLSEALRGTVREKCIGANVQDVLTGQCEKAPLVMPKRVDEPQGLLGDAFASTMDWKQCKSEVGLGEFFLRSVCSDPPFPRWGPSPCHNYSLHITIYITITTITATHARAETASRNALTIFLPNHRVVRRTVRSVATSWEECSLAIELRQARGVPRVPTTGFK